MSVTEESCSKMFEEHTPLDVKYESVKEFIETNHRLNNLLKETGGKLTSLQSSRDQLQQVVKEIQIQASQALN